MLHITLGNESHPDPTHDHLGRDRAGFAAGMSPGALYDAARAAWVLGERAASERYALFAHGGTVHQAIEITGIEKFPDGRSGLEGTILRAGHRVYDQHVGQPSPVGRVRNPVTYFASLAETAPCRCGCGAQTPDGGFVRGHDQTALHDRVRQIGTVAEFIDWFDVVRGDGASR